jgi:hypothetical protein
MPVRIVKDDDQPEDGGSNNRGGGGSSGVGGLGTIISLLLPFLLRNPKLAIAVLVIGGAIYFLMPSGNSGMAPAPTVDESPTAGGKGLGCKLNRVEFDKAQVFEPLAPGSLPRSISLERYAPRAGDQGQQGSCTAWATAYAARTIQESVSKGADPNEIAFSPSYLYNQLTNGSCTGTSIRAAMELVKKQGLVPLQEFPYNDQECDRRPNATLREQAQQFRLLGYNRLTQNGDDYRVDLNAIKQNLAQGAPVVIGMLVGGSFYRMQGKKLWQPTQQDFDAMQRSRGASIVNDGAEAGFGGHALCVIGYDDDYEGGAFQIQNSWGPDWGERGNFWMRYRDFEIFTNELGGEAYGLYPMPKANRDAVDFKATVGLVVNQTKQYIPVNYQSGSTFVTQQAVPKQTKFKIEVTNSIECYTYVLGQETDGSSYVLFPYTAKHSPYCGIVGQRLFPKDYSMQLDDKGTTDYMAVLLTKKELDVKALNDRVNAARAATYEAKLKEALGQVSISNVQFQGGQNVGFAVPAAEKADAVLVVFAINKK